MSRVGAEQNVGARVRKSRQRVGWWAAEAGREGTHASILSIPLEGKVGIFRVVTWKKSELWKGCKWSRWKVLARSLSFAVRYEQWPTRIPLSPP